VRFAPLIRKGFFSNRGIKRLQSINSLASFFKPRRGRGVSIIDPVAPVPIAIGFLLQQLH
jgi:hypothetical protein